MIGFCHRLMGRCHRLMGFYHRLLGSSRLPPCNKPSSMHVRPTHEAHVHIPPKLHAIGQVPRHAPHKGQQKGLFHVLVAVDLGCNGGGQAVINGPLVQQRLSNTNLLRFLSGVVVSGLNPLLLRIGVRTQRTPCGATGSRDMHYQRASMDCRRNLVILENVSAAYATWHVACCPSSHSTQPIGNPCHQSRHFAMAVHIIACFPWKGPAQAVPSSPTTQPRQQLQQIPCYGHTEGL